MDANDIDGEKGRLEMHKITMDCFEQILEGTFNKTAVVCPLTFYILYCPSKMNKACRTLLEK